jgi:hypothetical protein
MQRLASWFIFINEDLNSAFSSFNKVDKMYPTGQELFEDSESYLSELNSERLDIPINSFDVINRSMFKHFALVAAPSIAAIDIDALAVSSPDCSVSVKLTSLVEGSVTHFPVLISECSRKLVDSKVEEL